METKQTFPQKAPQKAPAKQPFAKPRYPVTLEGDTITCYVYFDKALLKTNPEWDMTYADVCVEGITSYWSDAGPSPI